MRIKPSYLAALAISVLTVAWLVTGTIRSPDRVEAAAIPPPAPPAQDVVRAVRVQDLVAVERPEFARVMGLTHANRRLEIKAETDGRVETLAVERGGRVAAGDVILSLAGEDRQARLDEARALLRQRDLEADQARSLAANGYRAPVNVAETVARREAARAAVTRMEREMTRLAINAPFAGVIESRPVELGAFVRVGDTVAMLVDLDPIRFVGHVGESDVTRLTLGGPARARVGDRMIDGRITFISASADVATRTFRVEVSAPNPDLRLIEGLSAEILLPTGGGLAHRITPASLSLADDGRIGVKLVEDDRVRFMPVRLIGAEGEFLWVTGLPARVRLITVGHDYVVTGQRVRAAVEPPPAAPAAPQGAR